MPVSPPIPRANALACNANWRTAASWRRVAGGRSGPSMWTTTSRRMRAGPARYAAMVSDLAAGVRDAVIVYNLDRLHRRPAELEEFVGLCERVGVRQVATVTADIDLGNDDGLFMARIFAAFAAKESGRKSARMKRKYEQNAQQGLPHGPARAFGYEPDKIIIREREAAVVRELVGRVIAGESVRALTVWPLGPLADGLR